MCSLSLFLNLARWFIYLMALFTLIFGVYLYVDDNQALKKIEDITENGSSTEGKSKLAKRYRTQNIILLTLLAVLVLPALLHYFSPRLIYIVLLLLLSVAYLTVRAFLAYSYRPLMVLPVFINAIAAVIFLLVACCAGSQSKEGSWKTFTKISSIPENSDQGKEPPPATIVITMRRKKKKRKKGPTK